MATLCDEEDLILVKHKIFMNKFEEISNEIPY